MSAYIVLTRTKTLDQKEMDLYFSKVKATFEGHTIEMVVGYGTHENVEGVPIEGAVIAKFPDMQAAKKWYFGDAYQAVLKHRKKGAVYNGFIVDGLT
jgi:uncharacterized protein (DUF1330 family)